jgi:hypothetical protein
MNRGPTVARFAVAAVGLALMVGCGKRQEAEAKQVVAPEPAMIAAPPTPIATKKIELGDDETWNPEWDKIVELALPPEMLSNRVPRDVRRFCPRFYEMSEVDKRGFWAYFFQALAGAEAGLKPTSRARHAQPEMAVKDNVTGVAGRTEGLLQLTYEDQERYGCDFDWERDKVLKAHDPERTILQPKNNLECGVRILEKQIINAHKPLLSGTGYWETLRPGTPGHRVFVKQMTNVPAACGVRVRSGRQVAAR